MREMRPGKSKPHWMGIRLGVKRNQTQLRRIMSFSPLIFLKNHIAVGTALPLTGLSLFVLLPSSQEVEKYTGVTGLVLFLTLGSIVFLLGYRAAVPVFLATITERQSLYLAIATLVILVVVFAIVYPIADSGAVGGGSDRDDALNIAARELLSGRYPYDPLTYLGNLITPLPGAVFLATPFVLIGNSAYQNLFWLAVFFVAARMYLKDGRSALILFWITAFSPVILQQLVTGGDLLSNSLYVIGFLWLMTYSITKRHFPVWKKVLPAILFGIALSSRANYFLILPLVFSMLVQNAGWRSAVFFLGVICFSLAVVTLPFYLYDPDAFSPLHIKGFYNQFNTVSPHTNLIFPLTGGVVAALLSLQRMDASQVTFLRNCAIVQGFPVLLSVVLASIQADGLNLNFAGYGTSSLFFGAVAFWAALAFNQARHFQDATARGLTSFRP